MAKEYHTPTSQENRMMVDPDTDRATVAFICRANHFTPAVSEALDKKIGLGTKETKKLPSESFVEAEAEADEWTQEEEQPPPNAFDYDAKRDD